MGETNHGPMAVRALVSAGVEQRRAVRAWRVLVVAVTTGLVGGLATYAYDHPALLPAGVPAVAMVAALVAAGAYVRPLAGTLNLSVRALFGAAGVSLVVHLGLSFLPTYLLGLAPRVLQVAFVYYGGQALATWIITFPGAFIAGYLLYVLVAGVFRP